MPKVAMKWEPPAATRISSAATGLSSRPWHSRPSTRKFSASSASASARPNPQEDGSPSERPVSAWRKKAELALSSKNALTASSSPSDDHDRRQDGGSRTGAGRAKKAERFMRSTHPGRPIAPSTDEARLNLREGAAARRDIAPQRGRKC